MLRKKKTDSKPNRRQFRFELLEGRAMMASDTCVHNFLSPEDADGSGAVSPLDALVVINELNSNSVSSDSTSASASVMSDVDGDSSVTPLDALVVINYLNRQGSNGTELESTVPVSTRISRAERAIAANAIPTTMTLDEAIEILARLRAGQRPELDSQFRHGHHQVDDSDDQTTDSTDSTNAPDATKLIERLTADLTEAGVSEETIATITTEITDAAAAGTPLTFTQIKNRLTELGVDVATVFENHHDQHDPVARLTAALTKAGVSTETITTITSELKDAAAAGTPLTLEQIKTRLTELGVDVAAIFGTQNSGHGDQVAPSDRLIAHLTRAGVDSTVIQTISEEIAAAEEAGTPLTMDQINTRLTELGVDVASIFTKPTGRPRRGHRV